MLSTKNANKRWIFGISGLLLYLAFAFFIPVPEVMDQAAIAADYSGRMAMGIMGSILLGICWWAGDVFPNWIVSLSMQVIWILFRYTNVSGAFHSYTNSTIWLYMALFCIATAINKTGLLRRIALELMERFSTTFRGQVLALMISGVICSPLIPSAAAKIVLGSMLALNIADAMGYENDSPGRHGLFIAALIGFGMVCPAFISAGTNSYAMLGVLPAEVQAQATYLTWFLAMLPWLLIIVAGMTFFIFVYYGKNDKSEISSEYVAEELRKMGKMSKNEKIVFAIISVCLFFWIFESVLHIDSTAVALVGAIICFLSGILENKEIATAPPWHLIIFVGGAINISYMLSISGLNAWFQHVLTPVFSIIGNKYILILIIVLSTIFIRFFIVSLTATITLTLSILVPILDSFGIGSLGVGLIIYASMLCWFVPYQNLVYIPGLNSMNGTIQHRGNVPACFAYEALSLIAFFISIPLWDKMQIL